MLNDLEGYFKRNTWKMKEYEVKKSLEQLKEVQSILENRLQKLKNSKSIV
jgi:hydrogenase maturation factor HypE